MNQIKKIYYCFFISLFLLGSCTEESYIYEVNQVTILPNNGEKGKEKSTEQFLNILYANLYQKPLSPNKLVELTRVIKSIGDKQVAFETVVAKMMKDPDVNLPSNAAMRVDIGAFITEAYKRFYVRTPTEAEKTFLVNFLESRPNLGPEHVYFSLATSNEYYYY